MLVLLGIFCPRHRVARFFRCDASGLRDFWLWQAMEHPVEPIEHRFFETGVFA